MLRIRSRNGVVTMMFSFRIELSPNTIGPSLVFCSVRIWRRSAQPAAVRRLRSTRHYDKGQQLETFATATGMLAHEGYECEE